MDDQPNTTKELVNAEIQGNKFINNKTELVSSYKKHCAMPLKTRPGVPIKISKAVVSGSMDCPSVSNKTSHQTSEDPLTPTYPPRSPTSDIVPTEFPLRHLYPKSRMFQGNEDHIHQLDGNIEAHNERHLIHHESGEKIKDNLSIEMCSASNDSSQTTSHDRRCPPVLISLSTNSTSSITSRSSSSTRGSMSDTVSIVSCSSSGYESEHNECTSESDYRSRSENVSLSNSIGNIDNIYVSRHKGCIHEGFRSSAELIYKRQSYPTISKNVSKAYSRGIYNCSYSKFNKNLSSPKIFHHVDGQIIPLHCENYVKTPSNNVNGKSSHKPKNCTSNSFHDTDLRTSEPSVPFHGEDESVSNIERLFRNAEMKNITMCIEKELKVCSNQPKG